MNDHIIINEKISYNHMSDLPYVSILSNIPKYFERIRQAETPKQLIL